MLSVAAVTDMLLASGAHTPCLCCCIGVRGNEQGCNAVAAGSRLQASGFRVEGLVFGVIMIVRDLVVIVADFDFAIALSCLELPRLLGCCLCPFRV